MSLKLNTQAANAEETQIKMEHKPVELVSAPACSLALLIHLSLPLFVCSYSQFLSNKPLVLNLPRHLSQLTIDKPAVLISNSIRISNRHTPFLQSPNSAVKDILSPKDMLSPTSVTSENPDKEESQTMVTEFLVKWKDKSFVHCEWISEDQIVLQEGFSGKNKIKRFGKGSILLRSWRILSP